MERVKNAKITVDLGDRNLYRRLRMAAADLDVTMREIIVASLRYYLDHQDDVEDYLFGQLIERRLKEGQSEQFAHAEVKDRIEKGVPVTQ